MVNNFGPSAECWGPLSGEDIVEMQVTHVLEQQWRGPWPSVQATARNVVWYWWLHNSYLSKYWPVSTRYVWRLSGRYEQLYTTRHTLPVSATKVRAAIQNYSLFPTPPCSKLVLLAMNFSLKNNPSKCNYLFTISNMTTISYWHCSARQISTCLPLPYFSAEISLARFAVKMSITHWLGNFSTTSSCTVQLVLFSTTYPSAYDFRLGTSKSSSWTKCFKFPHLLTFLWSTSATFEVDSLLPKSVACERWRHQLGTTWNISLQIWTREPTQKIGPG